MTEYMAWLLPDDKAKILSLSRAAERKPISLERMRELASLTREELPPDYNNDRTIEIRGGVRLTFTHEYHPVGLCRHLSVSLDNGFYPPIFLVRAILPLFGFSRRLEGCHIHEEDAAGRKAINIIEPVEAGDAENH
jgi:hypothetical protein